MNTWHGMHHKTAIKDGRSGLGLLRAQPHVSRSVAVAVTLDARISSGSPGGTSLPKAPQPAREKPGADTSNAAHSHPAPRLVALQQLR